MRTTNFSFEFCSSQCREHIESKSRASRDVKHLLTLLLLLTFSIGNVWAADWLLTNGNCNSDKMTWELTDVTFAFDKAHGGGAWTIGGNVYFKISANKTYTMTIPDDVTISNVRVEGYTNGSSESNFATIGGIDVSSTKFPKKASNVSGQTTNILDVPIAQTGGAVAFATPSGGVQLAVIITITGTVSGSGGSVAVTGITIAPSPAAVKVGKTITLAATVAPNTATDKTVSWSVKSGGTYASVNATTGVVTGLAEGTAVITATANDGSGVTQDVTVNVEEFVCPTSGNVFSMTVTSSSTVRPPRATDASTPGWLALDDYAIISGYGEAKAGNKATSSDKGGISNTAVNLDGNDGVFWVALDCPLQEGDIITATVSGNTVYLTPDLTRASGISLAVGTDVTYTVLKDDKLDGESNIYGWKGGGNAKIAAFSITRPVPPATHTLSSTVDPTGKGTVTLGKSTVAEGTTTSATYSAIDAAYDFDEWQISGTGASIDDASANPVTVTMGTSDATITLKLKLAAPKYDITYYPGTGGSGSIDPAKKTKDVDFVLSSERFTRAGYLQTGWAKSDGGAKVYELGATYTENAALDLYPFWTELDTYVASFACSDAAPAGWTFSNDGFGDSKATVAYVCKFVENGLNTPKTTTGDGTSDDNVAFAKNTDAIATFDIGVETTVAGLNVILNGGSSSAFNETIEYLGSDGSTVKKEYVNSLSAGNWKDNTISKTDVVENVRYIRIHGAGKWVIMKSFSVSYIETRTKYDVAFAAGTGASGSMPTLHYVPGAEVVLPACTFTAPAEKEFDVWTSSDVTITAGKFTMPAKNVNVTATWKEAITRFQVTFETNGGSVIPAQEVEENGHPTAVSNPTKDNYDFVVCYNNADLADNHAVPDITALTIKADLILYAKWDLKKSVSKIIFSNSFDAFIDVAHNTISAYYMAGESAPTIKSYVGNDNLKASPNGVVIEGNKIVLVGTDDSRKEFNLVLKAVTPLKALEALQTFDGTENYVKSAAGWDDNKGWRFQKVVTPDDGRETKGLTREYFFFGPAKSASFVWKVSKKNSSDPCVAKVYVNGTEVMDAMKDNFEVTLNKNTNNMVAIVSQQTNGDCGFASVQLTADYIRTEMLGAGVLGTICLEHSVLVASAQGASFYTLVGKELEYGKIVFDEIISGELEAGKPYIFQADGDRLLLLFGEDVVSEPDNSGALKGTFVDLPIYPEDAAGVYYFRDHALWSARQTGVLIGANRAYLQMDEVNPISSPHPAPGCRRITIGVNSTNSAQGIDETEATEKPIKIMIEGQLFILRGEKCYDATGRLVK